MVSRRQFLEHAGCLAGAAAFGARSHEREASTTPPLGIVGGRPAAAGKPSQRRHGARSVRTFIPLRDGTRLAATLVMPEGAEAEARFPALLTYDLYRGTESDGIGRFGYFAERGYVGARVDLRGTGSSGGRAPSNEYSVREGEDALDVVAWLAAQDWCNGNVGMYGSSYGGFNSIQVAMLQPPALKAIMPMHATDDVYTDDIVFYDGALQFESLGRWPLSMIASMGRPAFPDYDTDTAEARFRVEQEPWIFGMLREQRNSEFWRRMSLRPDYHAIKVPTFMIGGWLDAYTDSIPRMLEKLAVPTRAIIGQWTHAIGRPGPEFDARPEQLRWWDHWLKGIDTGMLEEPRLAMWVNEYYRPGLTIREIPGSWRLEEGWPVPRVREEAWYFQPDQALSRKRSADLEEDLEYKATVGTTNRYRCPHNSAELTPDQRPDDARSMSFTSAPLDSEFEILGFPLVTLYVSSTSPVATWIVRLCDVAPDGTSALVTKGLLNGTHHRSHERPEPLVPGRIYALDFDLKVVSWTFRAGHRLRVAISNADFPNLWPSPYRMTTKLLVDADHPSRIVLPVCPPERRPVPLFGPVEPGLAATSSTGPEPVDRWTVTRDELEQTVTVFRETSRGPAYERRWCTASDVDPAHAKLVAEGRATADRGSQSLVVDSWLTIESDEHAFRITARRELRENGRVKYGKSWEDSIPRDLV